MMPQHGGRLFKAASAVAEVVRCADSELSLRADLLHVLQPLIGFDGGAVMSAFPGQAWLVAGQNVDSRQLAENYWRYSLEAPANVLQALSCGFAQDLDIVDARTRDRAAVYREVHRPSGSRAFVARYWVTDHRIHVLGLSRLSARFTPRAVADLDALFPLLAAAIRAGALMRRDLDQSLQGFSEDYGLTARQREITELVTRGMGNREIGLLLGMSSNTVRNMLAEVFRKTRVTRRAELVYVAAVHCREELATESVSAEDRFVRAVAAASRAGPVPR